MTGAQGPTGMTGAQGQRGMTESERQRDPVAGWVSLREIIFDFDDADIRPSEMSKISDIASYVDQNPNVRLGIDGSTDLLRGTNQYNVALSQRRVANVRDALMRTGVSADRIETGGFASERAKCDDSIEQCSQRDGRVEVLARSNR
jgi:outer membrane protein OmpA-like peptidoglycan-associated protein